MLPFLPLGQQREGQAQRNRHHRGYSRAARRSLAFVLRPIHLRPLPTLSYFFQLLRCGII